MNHFWTPRSSVSQWWMRFSYGGMTSLAWWLGVGWGHHWHWWTWNPPWLFTAALSSLGFTVLTMIFAEWMYQGWPYSPVGNSKKILAKSRE